MLCGQDLFQGIAQFFRDGRMPLGVNSTYLALVPKVQCPLSHKDYRPVSCCNVIHKIISSILSNGLKVCLPKLIGASQSVFVLGRNITHNISLAHELVAGYKRKFFTQRCLMKIDICKAYDMVNWNFLKNALELFGFPNVFIKWVLACVTPARFSLLISGELVDYLDSNRGLRQCDPI